MIILTAILLAAAVNELLIHPGARLVVTPIHLAFAFYIIAVSLSLFNAINLSLGIGNLAFMLCLFTIFAAASWIGGPDTERKLNQALLTLTGAVCAIALILIVVPVPFLRFLVSPERGTISTFGNATYFAGFLVLVLPLVLGQIFLRSTGSMARWLLIALAAAAMYLLVRTEARSSWIAVLISIMCMLAISLPTRRARWIGAGVFVACLLGSILLFPNIIQHRIASLFRIETTSSISRRLFFYQGAWRAFLDSPLLGNGAGNFSVFLPHFRSPDYWIARAEDIVPHAHDELLETLAETGALGGMCLLAMAFLFGSSAWRKLRRLEGNERIRLSAYCCAIAGTLIDNLWSMNLRTIPVAVTFWMIAGISVRSLDVAGFPIRFALPAWVRRTRVGVFVGLTVFLLWYIPRTSARYAADRNFLDGILLRGNNNAAAAAGKFSEAVALDPTHAEARFYLAADLVQTSQPGRARDEIDTLLLSHPYYPKARLVLALALSELGDHAAARKAIDGEMAIDASPQVEYYAATIALKGGDDEGAYKHVRSLLEKNMANVLVDYTPEGVELLGKLCHGTTHGSECSGLLWEMERTFPTNGPVLAAIGSAYLELFDTARARTVLTQAERFTQGDRRLQDHIEQLLNKIPDR